MSIQKKQDLMIELTGARTPEDTCLAALSFRGGTACSSFATFDGKDAVDAWDGEGNESATIFETNRAFWHVFKAYVSKLDAQLAKADVFLDGTATMLAWGFETPVSVMDGTSLLFSVSPEKELFDAAKDEAFEEYAVKFSNPLFRFTHKILEQTEPAFGFTYEAFTKDFENIAFENFQMAWEKLVVPGNALLCLMAGDTERTQAAVDGMELPASSGEVVAMPVTPVVPIDRHMNIALLGASLFDLGALCFGGMSSFTPAEKKICLEVMNQHLFGGTGSVSIDLFDASIIFTERTHEDLLDSQAWQLNEEAFAKCASAVSARMGDICQRFPMLFAAEMARDLQQGINNVSIMQAMPRIPYEAFAEKLGSAFEQARQVRISQVCTQEEMLAV